MSTYDDGVAHAIDAAEHYLSTTHGHTIVDGFLAAIASLHRGRPLRRRVLEGDVVDGNDRAVT